MAAITGVKELDRKLKDLGGRVAKKAIAAGTRAELTALGKGLRAAINATNASSSLKREARAAVGSRFARGGISKTGRTTAKVAKVGFGVGKRTKAKKAKAAAKSAGRTRSGVGISTSNIHWFVLGTDERKQKTTGRSTGQVEGIFKNATRKAMATSSGAALAAARKKISEVIAREAKKR